MVVEAPASVRDWNEARRLIEQYGASLDVDLSFQDFSGELDRLPAEYGAPSGAMRLARDGSAYVGCVGVRRLDAERAEMKRLYVVPHARGRGVGRLLAQASVEAARALGCRQLLLDTLPSMREAHALYRSMGFRAVPAYRFNPVAGTAYLALDL